MHEPVIRPIAVRELQLVPSGRPVVLEVDAPSGGEAVHGSAPIAFEGSAGSARGG